MRSGMPPSSRSRYGPPRAPRMTALGSVAIVGAGRMGSGLAAALNDASVPVRLLGRARAPQDTLTASLVLIATPDDAIGSATAELARDEAITEAQVVLHLSGLLDRLALQELASTGAGLGSFHPLQSIADPASASGLLRGAVAGLEGDDRALDAGERL